MALHSTNLRMRRGFTLVELLVVIAIIGVLVALLLPAIQAAREAARRMSCSNNLKQLGLALHNYHDIYKTFPPDAIRNGNLRGTTAQAGDQRCFTWISMLLPFVEQQPLFDQIDFRLPGYNQMIPLGPVPTPLQSVEIPGLLCPTDSDFRELPHGFAYTSYAGNAGWDQHRRWYRDQRRAGVFSLMDPVRIKDIKDGTSQTIMLGEVTVGAYCCRNTSNDDIARWTGGSGQLRVQNSRVFRSALIAPHAFSAHSHEWVLDAGKGPLLTADGTVNNHWHVWSAPYASPPIYWDHYAMNVEWPSAGSAHSNGAQFCLADASVRYVSESISTGNHDNLGRGGNIWVAAHTIMGTAHNTRESQVVWP